MHSRQLILLSLGTKTHHSSLLKVPPYRVWPVTNGSCAACAATMRMQCVGGPCLLHNQAGHTFEFTASPEISIKLASLPAKAIPKKQRIG